MQFSINTPALLFPAIILLMLAYTNRFLALATLIRNLHTKFLLNEIYISTRALEIELNDMLGK